MQDDEQAQDRGKAPPEDQPDSGQQEKESLLEAQKVASEERKREGGYQ
jgi:hypothetical protein